VIENRAKNKDGSYKLRVNLIQRLANYGFSCENGEAFYRIGLILLTFEEGRLK